jgi:hypothetical protein
VTNFTASPAVVDVGQVSRLTWNESANLASVRVIGSGGDTNTYSVPVGQRFLDVRPASTANYTVVVTSNDCSAQTANQSLTVTVSSCPTISFFNADRTNIIQGASSTLQWNTSNAAQVLLNGSPVAASGSLVVTPASTTTYRLTTTSLNGTCNVDQFVTINVAACPAPQITSFTATPSSVLIGGNSMVRLAWSISDTSGTGVSVNISPGIGSFSAANGFVDISQPQTTTTYTITVTNGCGTTSVAQVTVSATPCTPPSIIGFTANPNAVTIGGSQTVRLSWTVSDPTSTGVSVTINGVGTWPVASGFVDIAQPQATTTYTLTTTNGCGASSSAQATVTATSCPPPTINSFDASPSVVIIGDNQTVRLSWNITDSYGTGVTINIAGVGTYFTTTGFVDIPQPQKSTTYSLTVTSGCGAASSTTTTVTAGPRPIGPRQTVSSNHNGTWCGWNWEFSGGSEPGVYNYQCIAATGPSILEYAFVGPNTIRVYAFTNTANIQNPDNGGYYDVAFLITSDGKGAQVNLNPNPNGKRFVVSYTDATGTLVTTELDLSPGGADYFDLPYPGGQVSGQYITNMTPPEPTEPNKGNGRIMDMSGSWTLTP